MGVKKHWVTKPIPNAGLSRETIGLGVPMGTAKSFGFCFYAGQIKLKQKDFAIAWWKGSCVPAPHCA